IPPEKRRARVAELILNEPLESEPGRREVYSDLNFILLGLILEEIGQARQDVLFNRLIAGPLGLKTIGYRPLDHGSLPLPENLAPTEKVPRRGGLLRGEVHDDNAAALAGVAGHAGLFGPVREVWRIFRSLRTAHRDEPGPRPVSPGIVRAFWQRSPHRTRALGFDTPSPAGSSAGRFFSPRSVGHLGFTGVSLWHDPDKDLTIILLTNRVHPVASNEAIKEFRPHIHDIAAETIKPRT
ncbi:MAG: serine hydrolase, partial [Thermodesulfobacteriota bacterium]|nr:serine hydrolase [Thermodesulfobacteriota bacterium]